MLERPDAHVGSTDRLVTRPFVVVTAAAFAFFLYIGVLVPTVPLFIEGPLDAGELALGLNVAAFAGAAIAVRPLIGRLADRHGRRNIIVVGALLAALSGVGLGQADSLAMVLVLRALAGIGEASVFVGAATLIADLSPRERRAEGASYFSVAVFGGLGVGPIIGEYVLADVRFERAFTIAGGFALLAALIAVFAPSRVVAADADEHDPIPLPDRVGWQRLIHPEAVLPGLVLACGVAGLTTFFQFIPDYSREAGLATSGGLFATYSVVSLLIRLFGAKLPERLGPRRSVTIALTLIGAGLLVTGAAPGVGALWVGAAFIGVGVAFNYPSLMALTVNRVSDGERATAVSSITMFFEVGSAVGGLAIGALAQVVGKQYGFVGGALACAVGIWVLRRHVVPADAPDAGPERPVVELRSADAC